MSTTRDILARKSRTLVAIEPTASVVACARHMSESGVGSVAIMSNGSLLGIVTRQDIMETVAHRAGDIERLTAHEIMTPRVHTATIDTPFADIEQEMVRAHIKHLPVLDGERVVGMITRIDVLQHHLAQASALNEVLEAYIYGVYPR